MFVLIDKEQMCVRYKHRNQTVLANMMHIELSHVAALVTACDWAGGFATLTDMELKVLYQNLCGEKYNGYSREPLIQAVMELCKSLPDSVLNGFEVSLQAGFINQTDEKYYRYMPGAMRPQELDDQYTPAPLTASATAIPLVTPPKATHAAPSAYTQAATAPASAPRPRPSSAAPPEAPKAGSKTGRVWELAEIVWEKAGKPTNVKDIRKQIIDACEAEGINSSTASVQYGKWKANKGL